MAQSAAPAPQTGSATQASVASSSKTGPRVSAESPVLLESRSTTEAGVNLSLHPLPILNISEHLVSAQLQSAEQGSTKVYGAILGTQSGRDIEIQNSFEFSVITSPGAASVDHDFLRSRQNQFKQVFPTFDFLGWYSVGSVPTQADLDIHTQLLEYNEAPLFLQLSPTPRSFASSLETGELPVSIYESVLEMSTATAGANNGGEGGADATMFFVRAPYRIETGEAERIAVDHASRPPEDGDGGEHANMLANLNTQQNAIKMLTDRIRIVTTYVESVQAGALPRNDEALRQIAALVACLPASDLPEFKDEFLTEYNDVLLTTQLASLTKSLHSYNELSDKADLMHTESHGSSFGPPKVGRSRQHRVKGGRERGGWEGAGMSELQEAPSKQREEAKKPRSGPFGRLRG